MPSVNIAPYGSWRSPITASSIVAGAVVLRQPRFDGDDLYWLEMRPEEAGRIVLVRLRPGGQPQDVTPPGFYVRTRVHEYGGGAYTVHQGIVYFSNYADQRVYRQRPGAVPEPLTPVAKMRYADYVFDVARDRLICIREDHTEDDRDAHNAIVALSLTGGDSGRVLAEGYDFYSSPRLSPGCARLAWLSWNHPNMPWDGCELWVATVEEDGSLGHRTLVAGGPNESIFQPAWSKDGALYFVSDRTGWWNLYSWQPGQVRPLCPMEAEFGRPQWSFDATTYQPLGPDRLICSYAEDGDWRLALLDTQARKLRPIATPFTDLGGFASGDGHVAFVGSSPTEPATLARLDLDTGQLARLRRSSTQNFDSGYLSAPQAITFPTEQGLEAHGFYYAPNNRDFVAPEGDLPPLLVMSHGGPTGATSSSLDLEIQFWTSRGIAVLDVNYGGSTGYGRAYRERLKGAWGIVDVDDCVNGARYLARQGFVDGRRLAITGGSAGGYTTLCALTFREAFAAGASYYGVSDPAALAADTHKFESRYLDGLIAPYPEDIATYEERSPIHHVDRLARPIILLQGLEDPVVPPAQSQRMYDAVRAKGLPTAYLPFEGESHGFRKAQNIKRALEAEFYFYSRIFGFKPADAVEPVPIANLD